jgi:Zn-dependent protease/CBS domain-containing protein
MLRGGIPIGRLFGVSLRLHYSWFLIFALVTWALSASYFPATQPTWSSGTRIAAGVLTSLLFFGSVLAHELTHSIVAIREGIPVQSITLFVFGGVSQIAGEPKQAKDEFRMALAGPLSSLLISALFWAIWLWWRGTNNFVTAIAFWLGWINASLAVFNLIPGFPLDGGRVLRSILWWRSQNLRNATRIASNIGRGAGYLFIFAGIWLVFSGNWFDGIWLALIGWFLESAAVGSYRQLLLEDMLKGHVASEVMSQDCIAVPPDITIERLVNDNILASGRRCFLVTSNGHVEGLITIHNIKAVPRDLWSTKPVREAMTPLQSLKSVQPNEDLNTVLKTLVQNDINQVPVISNNDIVGMVSRDNIVNFISARSELGGP